jgi:hypothetical protein
VVFVPWPHEGQAGQGVEVREESVDEAVMSGRRARWQQRRGPYRHREYGPRQAEELVEIDAVLRKAPELVAAVARDIEEVSPDDQVMTAEQCLRAFIIKNRPSFARLRVCRPSARRGARGHGKAARRAPFEHLGKIGSRSGSTSPLPEPNAGAPEQSNRPLHVALLGLHALDELVRKPSCCSSRRRSCCSASTRS